MDSRRHFLAVWSYESRIGKDDSLDYGYDGRGISANRYGDGVGQCRRTDVLATIFQKYSHGAYRICVYLQ